MTRLGRALRRTAAFFTPERSRMRRAALAKHVRVVEWKKGTAEAQKINMIAWPVVERGLHSVRPADVAYMPEWWDDMRREWRPCFYSDQDGLFSWRVFYPNRRKAERAIKRWRARVLPETAQPPTVVSEGEDDGC